MEDSETRAREYIQQAYVEGGANDVAVLAQLARRQNPHRGASRQPVAQPRRQVDDSPASSSGSRSRNSRQSQIPLIAGTSTPARKPGGRPPLQHRASSLNAEPGFAIAMPLQSSPAGQCEPPSANLGSRGQCGRYNAGAGRGQASFAPLTARFTLGYTEKTSIKPVIART
jgi:hypothetical protein